MDVVTLCRWHHTLRATRLTYIIKHTKGPHTRKRRKRDNGLWPLHFIKAEHFHYSRLLCSWTLYVRICFLSLMSLTNVTKSCPEELPLSSMYCMCFTLASREWCDGLLTKNTNGWCLVPSLHIFWHICLSNPRTIPHFSSVLRLPRAIVNDYLLLLLLACLPCFMFITSSMTSFDMWM